MNHTANVYPGIGRQIPTGELGMHFKSAVNYVDESFLTFNEGIR